MSITEWLREHTKRRKTAWGVEGLAGCRFDEAADAIDAAQARALKYEQALLRIVQNCESEGVPYCTDAAIARDALDKPKSELDIPQMPNV